MKAPYRVTTKDVDGGTTRKYFTYKAAIRRFQTMSGYKLPKGHREYSVVSDYGCVVTFWAHEDAPMPTYATPADVEVSKYDDEGCRVREEYVSSPYGTYGGTEHQAYGDAWLYRDCPGAW